MAPSRQKISLSDASNPFYAGVDVGGTNTKIGLVDDLGRTLAYTEIPTSPEQGPDDAVKRMAEGVTSLAEESEIQLEKIAHVGLATPGTMDIPAGKFLEPPNLPGWDYHPIRDKLRDTCGRPVAYANDAGAAAYGEYWVGSGKAYHSIVLLTLGTGLGGGIIVGNISIDGENSHGAECGHIIIDHSETARMCPCGQRGHLEAYSSAKAIIKRAREALEAGRESLLKRSLEGGEKLSPLLIGRHAEEGDELAMELILDTAMYLGVGVVTLMHTIDPGAVILGGAMTFGGHQTELGRRFLDRVREEVSRRAFPIPAEKTTIDYAKLGSDAGYIGAAGIARSIHRGVSGE